jgi:DNA polymerase/3'-5' exonuclease PolX
MVGDLDFVVLTTISQVKAVKDRCLQNATEVLIDGPQNFVFTVGNGVQIDIFFARPPELELFGSTPGNWGTLMLCRTGSRQFNAWLCNEAKKRGAHWDPYTGVWGKDGRLIPCEDDEREVFQAIGVDYVPPTKRER